MASNWSPYRQGLPDPRDTKSDTSAIVAWDLEYQVPFLSPTEAAWLRERREACGQAEVPKE